MNVASSKKDFVFVVLVCLLLLVIVFQIYWPVYHHDFINYDDNLYVTENNKVKEGITIETIKWAFVSFKASNWHPVTWLSHMLDVNLFGLDAGKHHIINVIIHTVNAVMLFFVFFRTTNRLWPSFFVSAFFAVHPMHVESVAWIAERKDVLSFFFMLITFLFYIGYVRKSHRIYYWASVFFFAVGLMSKPMIVTLPCILLLFDYWPLQRLFVFIKSKDIRLISNDKDAPSSVSDNSFKRSKIILDFKSVTHILIEKIPFFLLSIFSSAITIIAQTKGGSVAPVEILNLNIRLSNAIISYSEYIRKLFYPVSLFLPYPYPSTISLCDLIVSVIIISIFTAIAFYNLLKKPYLTVGWLWYIGSLVPVIGIIQVGSQSMADRYTYIPYTGLFIILVFGIDSLYCRAKYFKLYTYTILFSALVFFIYLADNQVRLWKDSFSVFGHSIEMNYRNPVAHINIGEALRRDNRVLEAMNHFAEALRIDRNQPTAFNGIGLCYAMQKRYTEALSSFAEAVRLKSDFDIAYYNIGFTYLKLHLYNEAVSYFIKAIELNPDYADAYYCIGFIYVKQGRKKEAIPFFQNAYNLGFVAAKKYLDSN